MLPLSRRQPPTHEGTLRIVHPITPKDLHVVLVPIIDDHRQRIGSGLLHRNQSVTHLLDVFSVPFLDVLPEDFADLRPVSPKNAAPSSAVANRIDLRIRHLPHPARQQFLRRIARRPVAAVVIVDDPPRPIRRLFAERLEFLAFQSHRRVLRCGDFDKGARCDGTEDRRENVCRQSRQPVHGAFRQVK